MPAAPATEPTPSWTALDREGVVGLTDGAAWLFDGHSDARGALTRGLDGATSSIRPVAGLTVAGQPDYWIAAPGGYLAQWDAPVFIDEADGALSLRWQATAGRWWGAHHLIAGWLLAARYRPDAAVVALSLDDGAEVWRAELPRESQGVTFHADADTLYVSWTQYSATAPTPQIEIPMRVRALDLRSGAERWTMDFDRHPGALAAGQGVVLAAFDADLHFIRGATGERAVVATGQPPNIYPGVLLDGDRVWVALNEAVTAYDLSGAERWRAPALLDGGPRLALGGPESERLLFVTTEHNTILALDPDTGARAWEIGVGVDAYGLLADERAVIARAGGASAGVALPARVPIEEAVVSGGVKIVCDPFGPVVLAVGDQRVTPDADGRYSATVRAAGILTVGAPGAGMGEPGQVSSAAIRLDGSGRYEVPELTLDYCER